MYNQSKTEILHFKFVQHMMKSEMEPPFDDAESGYTEYAKNYCNWTLIVQVIVEM